MDNKAVGDAIGQHAARCGAALVLLLAPLLAAAGCGDPAGLLLALRVDTDRGELQRGGDRQLEVRLYGDGCLSVQRPPGYASPGLHVDTLADAEVQTLAALASPQRIKALEQSARLALRATAARAGEVPARAIYISHPTRYVLTRAEAGGAPLTVEFESTLQRVELAPESAELVEAATLLRAVLALQQRPGLRAVAPGGAQP